MIRIIEILKRKRLFMILVNTSLFALSVTLVYATEDQPVPNTFIAGTQAIAEDVNDNFTHLVKRSWDLSDANLLYYNNGNIGIGTTSPSNPLTVISSTEDCPILARSTQSYTPVIVVENIVSDWYTQISYSGTGRDYFTGVGNSEETYYGVADKWYVYDGSALTMRLVIDGNGNVGIGTTSPSGKLDVNGSIYQRGISLHADYVFETDYKLESIEEHAEFMWNNKHLKAIPKAKIDKDGLEILEVGAHRKGIVEELEKAHIYIEQLYEQNKKLEQQNKALEERLEKVEASVLVKHFQ
jgi:hypothetical protein